MTLAWKVVGSLIAFPAWLVAVTVGVSHAAAPIRLSEPVQLVAPSTAGSSADILARELAAYLEPRLQQPVQIINRPGGDGAVALAYVSSRPADGHTYGIITRSLVTAIAGGDVPVSLADFTGVARLVGSAYIVGVRGNSPYRTVHDLIGALKQGRRVIVGGFSRGSGSHLAALQFLSHFGIKELSWVAFPGTADAVAALLGGHVDAAVVNADNLIGHVRAGRAKVLLVSSSERLEGYPDALTFSEAGAPEAVQTHWRGVVARRGVDHQVIQGVAELLAEALQSERLRRYVSTNLLSQAFLGPAEFDAYLQSELATLQQLRRETGL